MSIKIGLRSEALPAITQKPPVIFPKNVVGYTSPYPTVVMVTIAHQKE